MASQYHTQDVSSFRQAGDDAAPRYASALYAYTAANADELTITEKDAVVVLRENNDGWCRAVVGSRVGLVPSNYLEYGQPNFPAAAAAGGGGGHVKALFPYHDDVDGNIDLTEGAIYELEEKSNADWWKLRDASGCSGYAPANYLELTAAPAAAAKPPPPPATVKPTMSTFTPPKPPAANKPALVPTPSSNAIQPPSLAKKPVLANKPVATPPKPSGMKPSLSPKPSPSLPRKPSTSLKPTVATPAGPSAQETEKIERLTREHQTVESEIEQLEQEHRKLEAEFKKLDSKLQDAQADEKMLQTQLKESNDRIKKIGDLSSRSVTPTSPRKRVM